VEDLEVLAYWGEVQDVEEGMPISAIFLLGIVQKHPRVCHFLHLLGNVSAFNILGLVEDFVFEPFNDLLFTSDAFPMSLTPEKASFLEDIEVIAHVADSILVQHVRVLGVVSVHQAHFDI